LGLGDQEFQFAGFIAAESESCLVIALHEKAWAV
jgi:hypothetical protein